MPAVIATRFFTSLAFVVVCMRTGTRVFLLNNIGVENGLIVLPPLRSLSCFPPVIFPGSASQRQRDHRYPCYGTRS